jgi:hypothetical protein
MLTVSLPRYVQVACCDDTSHVSNCQDLDFFRQISGSEKSLTDAAAAGERTMEARILNILEFFGSLESPLQELTTVDGTSIWAGVHLTSNATRVAAMKLMACTGGGETAEPANKRAGISDSGSPPCGQARAAYAAATALAGATPTLAVWPAAGEPERQFPPARPAARRTGGPKHERRPTRICEDASPPPQNW